MKKLLLNSHPFLFTLASILFLYSDARLAASPGQIIRPAIVLSFILVVLYPLAYWVTRDWNWAGILLSVLVFGMYFSRRDFFDLGLLVVTILVASFISFRLLKRRFQVEQLSLLLTLVSFGAVCLQSILIMMLLFSIPTSYYERMVAHLNPASLVVPLAEPAGEKPDIYYIILDGYPRADILQDYYGFDNSPFIDELRSLGFIVPQGSHSNYSRTYISVSTTLDMQYWNMFPTDANEIFFWWMATPMIDHSRVRASLESIGYQSISIASDFGLTDNPTTDLYFKPYPVLLSDYENYLINSTPLRVIHGIFRDIAPVVTSDVHRRYILFNFETLKKIPEIPGPKFVVSHIIAPHLPFVFNADGSPIESQETFTFGGDEEYASTSKEEYRKGYIGQVIFVNNQIRRVIEEIQKKSTVPPIIILQADHGSAMLVDFEAPEESCLRERFSNFAAYYLPGKRQDIIPQDITPVNLFRIIFDEYFGAHLDLLEDRQYFRKGYDRFNLIDVTEQVQRSCTINP